MLKDLDRDGQKELLLLYSQESGTAGTVSTITDSGTVKELMSLKPGSISEDGKYPALGLLEREGKRYLAVITSDGDAVTYSFYLWGEDGSLAMTVTAEEDSYTLDGEPLEPEAFQEEYKPEPLLDLKSLGSSLEELLAELNDP